MGEQGSLEERVLSLERELSIVKKRNARVETDKAWETSATRKVVLALITYFLTSLVFWLIGVERFWRNAAIPAVAFYISTLTLPAIKAVWQRWLPDRQ